jgi:hypothetical protein
MFDRIKTLFKGKESPKTSAAKKFAPAAPVSDEKARAGKEKSGAKSAESTTKERKATSKTSQTPEERCGITAKMSKDEIRARLALLYRRYNRATSSLDAGLRAESEEMLDAIVAVRERTFGPI